VFLFSSSILALACELPVFARLVADRTALRVSLVPAAGAVLSSLANVLEDGLQLAWAFYPFVSGSASSRDRRSWSSGWLARPR